MIRAVEMQHRRFTMDEFHRMGDADILGQDDRAKLIGAKLPMYATAGIAEYWIVDIPSPTLERFTTPGGNDYRHTARAIRRERLASSVLPEIVLDVDEVVG